ncbi:MAG: DUF2303 family protein [Methylovulum sp.]|nr:DUF2303 family protein [Methylovulum sp.]
MLNKESIAHIEENGVALSAMQHLIEMKENADRMTTAIDGIILPKDYILASFEKYLPVPFVFKASLSTTSIADWLSYVNSCASEDTGIYINKQEMSALAIIDQGSHTLPRWGKHRATLTLVKTPEYADLLKYNGNPIAQKDMINLLLDWEDCIQCYIEPEISDPGQDAETKQLTFKQSLQSFRRLTIDSISHLEQIQNDASGSVDVKQAYNVSAQGQTPINKIVMTTAGYEGLDETQITIMLRYDKSASGVIVFYRIIKQEQMIENRAQAFKKYIDNGINNKDITPVIASIVYQ